MRAGAVCAGDTVLWEPARSAGDIVLGINCASGRVDPLVDRVLEEDALRDPIRGRARDDLPWGAGTCHYRPLGVGTCHYRPWGAGTCHYRPWGAGTCRYRPWGAGAYRYRPM